MEEVNAINAQHATDFATVGKQDVLDRLRASSAAGTEQLRQLDAADLERTAGVFCGHELTIAQLMEWIFIGHAAEHLASIRAAIAD